MKFITGSALILIILANTYTAAYDGCPKRKVYKCKTHADCLSHGLTGHACVDKNGKKICIKCRCADFHQCKWENSEIVCDNCGEGIYGDHCECRNETRPCDEKPCVHGCCIDHGDQFECQCKSGWTGSLCDEDKDECTPNPCGVGTCQNEINKFKCICPDGYVDNCQGVDPERANLLLGYHSVSASSVYEDQGPEYAVDNVLGKKFSYLYHNDLGDTKPSFEVKMIKEYKIKRIVLYNRQEYSCNRKYDTDKETKPNCGSRLRDLTIFVGNNICATYSGPATNQYRVEIPCTNEVSGDVIKIEKDGLWLHFSEIEAFSYKYFNTLAFVSNI